MAHEGPNVTNLAVVLLSGGLDSATALAIARSAGFDVIALTLAYGQRHRLEIDAARAVARAIGVVEHIVMPIDLRTFGGSALTDERIEVPIGGVDATTPGIPVTYVPARNTVFLSLAAACAEARNARDIFVGVNAVDYSGYPDCRPDFIRAFEAAVNLGTRAGIEGRGFRIHTPLIELTKADIIRRGLELGVDYSLTKSCYDPDEQGRACGRCDSCVIRRRGFETAHVADPTAYASMPPDSNRSTYESGDQTCATPQRTKQ